MLVSARVILQLDVGPSSKMLLSCQDVIEEAADWALNHPPAPISKREVHKTNRWVLGWIGLFSRLVGCYRYT